MEATHRDQVTVLTLGSGLTVTRRPAERNRHVPEPTSPKPDDGLATLLAHLSTAITTARHLRAERPDDVRLQRRLDWMIDRLEEVGDGLLTDASELPERVVDPVPEGPEAESETPSTEIPAAEATGHDEPFLAWLHFCVESGDHLETAATPLDPSFDRFLAGLERSTRPLPRTLAVKLGLPVGATVGETAAAVRGPRSA